MSLTISTLGRYHLLHQIGNGGTGTVYLAQDEQMSRQVALKVIHIDHETQNTSVTQRLEKLFLEETRAVAQLNHIAIAPILDVSLEKTATASYLCVSMEHYPAGSLANWQLQESNEARLSFSDTARILSQVAEALFFAHKSGISHQDIKLSNILLHSPSSQPGVLPDALLTDFALARLYASTSDQGMSQSSYIRTTHMYLAPEQWDGKAVLASDQYALAVVAFRLLTGQFPFQGMLSQVIRQHHKAQPPSVIVFNPDLDPSIDRVIQRALSKKPEDRFSSIRAFAQAFTAIECEKKSPQPLASPISPVPADRHFIAEPLSSAPTPFSSQKEPSQKKTSPAMQAPPLIPQSNHSPQLPMESKLLFRRRLTFKQKIVLSLLIILLLAGGGVTSIMTLHTQFLQKRSTTSASLLTVTQRANRATAISTGKPAPTIIPTASATVKVANPGATTTTQTPTATPTVTAPAGWHQVLNDPMTASNHDSYWETDNSCVFRADHYEQTSTGSNYCAHGNSSLPATVYSDLFYSLDLSIQKGTQAGLVFRNGQNNYYYFSITTTGNYILEIHQSADGGQDTTIASGTSSAIHQGQGQWNTLAVIARRSSFQLYINNVPVTNAADTTYTQGIVCVAVNGAGPQNVFGDVWFKNARVWIP